MPKESFEDFKKKWEAQIAKIEKQALDDQAVNLIRIHFSKNKHIFQLFAGEEKSGELYWEMDSIESSLETALQIARSRFKLEHRGILARFFGGLLDKATRREGAQ